MAERTAPIDAGSRVDLAQFISETHRAQFDERRRHEFQTLFVTLAFFALCSAAALSKDSALPKGLPVDLYALVAFLGLTVVTSLRLAGMHDAGNKNKSFAENAEDFIALHLSGTATENDKCAVFNVRDKYWTSWTPLFYRSEGASRSRLRIGLGVWLAETLVLLLFAVVSAFIVRWATRA